MRNIKYFTEEERCAAKKNRYKRYRERHPEKIKEYKKTYRKTQMCRAYNLLRHYRDLDRYYNRGECTLTTQWIIDNIFTKPCVHCGKTGWNVVGCNRINNSLPHTPENVEPCCYECNVKLSGVEKAIPIYQYTLTGELVRKWESATRAANELGLYQANIQSCCKGKRKTSGGYRWSFIPL